MRNPDDLPRKPGRSTDEDAAKTLMGCIGVLLLIPIGIAWTFAYAAVAVKLWDWYVVPEGYDSLPYAIALGSFIIATLFRHADARKDDREWNWWIAFLMPPLKIGIALGFGWFGTLFI